MRFSDITGHEVEKRKLTAMADSRKIPHALLLHGPAGIGKMAMARAFVQYIGCSNRQNGDSCGKCPACLQTAKLNNPDVHYIYPVTKKRNANRPLSTDFAEEWQEFITDFPYMPSEDWPRAIDAGNTQPMIYVTESDEILRVASLSAFGEGYKFFIVWQPEKMNPAAANKLLKILEEPFEDTVFIFVSNDPSEILPTVRSRLQSVEFPPMPDDEIIKFFVGKGKSVEEAHTLKTLAGGDMNLAAMLADTGGEYREFMDCFISVMRASYARNMIALRDLSSSFAAFGREKSIRLLNYFGRMIRESFISNLHHDRLLAMTPEERIFVKKFGPFIHAANVEEMISETDRAALDISRNVNQNIVWFDFMVQLTRLIRTHNKI